ncbi:MAG: glycosyltransferase [Sphingobium sp.]
MNDTPPRILHLHGSFNLGGKEARAVRLMNLWRDRVQHTIVSADPRAMGARQAVDPRLSCDYPMEQAPSLRGRPGPVRYLHLARFMQQFDLVLSYNWGAMDGVMAHRLWSTFLRLPPLVHHEDGFNEDEAARLNPKRNLFRRLALGSAHALVVPSHCLHDIARKIWLQPLAKVALIPNGIDVAAYAALARPDAIPGFRKREGRITIGTLAGLRAVKNLPRLVRAVAPLGDKVQLVIVGEGPERQTIADQAEALGMRGRLHLPGFLPDPSAFIGLFDIFALSSDSEQFPISLVEAMAAGLPVVSTDVGDVGAMLPDENRAFVVARDDEAGLTAALGGLTGDISLRASLGQANRAHATAHYQEQAMVARYAALYEGALGCTGILQ